MTDLSTVMLVASLTYKLERLSDFTEQTETLIAKKGKKFIRETTESPELKELPAWVDLIECAECRAKVFLAKNRHGSWIPICPYPFRTETGGTPHAPSLVAVRIDFSSGVPVVVKGLGIDWLIHSCICNQPRPVRENEISRMWDMTYFPTTDGPQAIDSLIQVIDELGN